MDSKYENLPGIAIDEQDVYETAEPVHDDQQQQQQQQPDTDDSVQQIQITQKDAYDIFNKSSGLKSTRTDFSDSISNRNKMGYLVDRDAYEYGSDSDEHYDRVSRENLAERFNRIQKELNELKNDINAVVVADGSSDTQATPKLEEAKIVSKQLETIVKEVNSLHFDINGRKYDALISSSSSSADARGKKQLLFERLDDSKKSLLPTAKTAANNQKSNEDNGVPVTIKLFNEFNDDSLKKLAKVSDIDQRITRLESIIGSSQHGKVLAALCANIDNKTLLGLVEHLERKTNLVDQSALDLIENKLNWVLQRAQQLNEKKTLVEDNEKMLKISELYEMTAKWKDTLSTLPGLTQHLASLNELHQQAFQFESTLKRLDFDQQSIKQTIDTNNTILTKLSSKLDENVNSINASLDSLNSRILTLS